MAELERSTVSFPTNRDKITHLLWPKDPAQSLDLRSLLEARLADGHRKASDIKPYTTTEPHILRFLNNQTFHNSIEAMPLLLSGKGFRRELEASGCIAINVPLEGGAETRLLRRLRAAGYRTQIASARGLGDPEVFLMQLHGIRPPHLGHQSVGRNGALGEVQQVIPQLNELLAGNKPVVLWLIEGQVLSRSELLALSNLCKREPRLKIVIEMGGARSLKWQPINALLNN